MFIALLKANGCRKIIVSEPIEHRRKLALDDVDNGDLVRTDPDDDGNATDMYLESYAWHSGYCQYVRERD